VGNAFRWFLFKHFNDFYMTQTIQESFTIPSQAAGKRLDQIVSDMLPDYSRALIQSWIKEGQLLLDGKVTKTRHKLLGGEQVAIDVQLAAQDDWQAENIPLSIVYEDDDILVINKPAGLVVHPAAGNRSGTLLNALIYYSEEQALLPRAGIVHRLDKDTSGLMVVAKSLPAHTGLVQQIQNKEVTRQYFAIAIGEMTGGRIIEEPIGRHSMQRTKMSVDLKGKAAVTHIRLMKRFKNFTYIGAQLETGRTHQIRVHMSHIGYPLVGDPVYGGRNKLPRAASEKLKTTLMNFKRQALHSSYLGLEHPISGAYLDWQVDPPEDFTNLLSVIAQECGL
jgi:23S rRNA pseudouridine1911/1915/1917 synthase